MEKTADKKVTMSLASLVYKTAKMGGESITDVLPKIKGGRDGEKAESMRSELSRQFSEYESIASQAEAYILSMDGQPKEENIMAKMASKMGIMMNTMKDPSPSHVAEMMVQGLAMGIAEVTADVREAKANGCDENVIRLANRLVSFQEEAVDRIKAFL